MSSPVVPLVGEVIVTHGFVLMTVQLHEPPAVVSVTSPFATPESRKPFDDESEYRQLAAACVMVNSRPATKMLPVRGDNTRFAAMV